MSDTAILMSIRPVYTEAIFTGRKTVELRRRRPGFGEGTTVLVYSSAPEQVVRGTFRVGDITAAPPDDLWSRVKAEAAISRADFDSYFAGCEIAYAIQVRDPHSLTPTAISLRPPQSYLILRSEDDRHQDLLALAALPVGRSVPRRALSFARGAAQRVVDAAVAAVPQPASGE